ncbi:hypothetical protein HDU92_002152 [Lobulomyces angularis]|nr:hypothetical protein HDU92_002152 [Lobulomyces angularis]
MGQHQSKPTGHFSLQEIEKLRKEFKKRSKDGLSITKDQFRDVLKTQVQCWSAGAQFLFLDRLFDAFDLDNSKSIEFNEFIGGLGVFLKGTPEEKMELSFRLYDVDKSGSIEPNELIKIMGQLYSAFFNSDQTAHVKQMVNQIFNDLDINGDQSLSISEYKLMALKEPIMIDILEQFLYVEQCDRRKSLI